MDAGEECDDGNTTSGDGCSAACQLEALCGNGIVEGVEECDDGNASNQDSCTNACLLNICGDGFFNVGIEECDDGNTTSGDGCSATCQLEGEAGNCADGIDNDGDTLVDCDDPDCARDTACAPAEVEDCSDGIDNDEDGFLDCEDPDCAGDPACPPRPAPIPTIGQWGMIIMAGMLGLFSIIVLVRNKKNRGRVFTIDKRSQLILNFFYHFI